MAESLSTTRIALVTQGYFTGGGVPAVVNWLAEGLRESGQHEVDVFNLATSATDPFSRRILSPRTWLRRSLQGPLRDGVAQFGANGVELELARYRPRRELKSALRSYDIIQVVGGSPALGAAVLSCGRPVFIQTATTVEWERASRLIADRKFVRAWRQIMTLLVRKTEVRALQRARAVLVENDQMYEFARSKGQERVLMAPPGVDTRRFSPAEQWQSDGYLLSVCRLGDARKGLDRLVRAYKILRDGDETVPRLVIAGRGELRTEVADLIGRLGLVEHIDVLADIPWDELPEIIRCASVFIQTSYEEGLGISVLEAMSSGLPIVATRTAGSEMTVADGETGRLVSQASSEVQLVEELALAVREMLLVGGSVGAAARDRAIRVFSYEVCLRRFMAEYDVAVVKDQTSLFPSPG